MSNFTKKITSVLVIAGFCCVAFFSCQKANPAPYSNPKVDAPQGVSGSRVDTTPNFMASVNSSSVLSFTPSKSIVGLNTNLKGTSTFYIITLTFPSSTGPGHYTIGTSFYPDYTATLVNGGTTYIVNKSWGLGSLIIDSISANGKYYGSFDFDAEDSVTHADVTVNQGSFYHL